MSVFTTKPFWVATAERAIKTAAQTAAATIVVNATGVLDADWQATFSVTALATVLSVLSSLGSASAGGNGPSLTTVETVDFPEHRVE